MGLSFTPPPDQSALDDANEQVEPRRTDTDVADEPPSLNPGQMRFGWRVALFVLWLLAIGVLSSIWQLTVQIGHHTAWLGPAGDPHPWYVQILPFIGPAVVLYGVMVNARWVVPVGVVVAILLAVLGVIDTGFYVRLGWLEVTAGAMCLLGTVAATTGRVANADESHHQP